VGKMIGIDLGTTNSCVAVMEGGVPQVIPNQEGARTTPSIVGFTAKGERLVGQIAKRQALTNPKNTVFAVKRLIGRKFDSSEATEARQFLPFQLVESANGDVHIQIEDKVYSPPEISSFVLQKLKAAAEDYLGETVEEAIITVPAYFNDPQRQATKDAGLIAGLKVSRIINEPTAAALAYGLKNAGANGQLVAVYDLGGGTFDITILEMTDGTFMVRATGGDTYLGGEDFDQKIIDWLIGEFQRETAIDLHQDRMALQRLKEAAEKAKCELSTSQQTEIVLPFISADASGPKHLNTVLTRQRYEELTDALLEKTIEPCRRCLTDAGVKPEQVDEVLLVGGQTRAPKVAEIVRKVFGKEPNRAVNPDEGVAMGAAIQTGILQGEVKDLVLLDVTPHTLGIETKDGTFTPLIDRNSTIPTRKSRVFTTVADNQTRVEVHVLQGESDMAAYNKSLAKFELTNIPPAPRGVPQIEVMFDIDVNGIVSVTAQDQATGRAQSMVLHPSGGLSQAEVSRLVNETRAREAEEKSKKDQEAVVRQLDGLVANTMRSVQALEGKLTGDEQERILQAIEKAKKARADAGLDDLRGRLADMERAAAIIGQAMLRP
jgi:molecular chaperone DnaK